MSKLKSNIQEIKSIVNNHLRSSSITYADIVAGNLKDSSPEISMKFHPTASTKYRYDLASLTKALVTTPLIFEGLHEHASCGLNSSVNQWLKKKLPLGNL